MSTPSKVTNVKASNKEDPVPPSVEELEKQHQQENEVASQLTRTSTTPDLDLSIENGVNKKVTTPEKTTPVDLVKTQQVSVVLEKLSPTVPVVGVSKKKRSRKRKSNRAPDAPKFPLTGYVRYINERRETLKSEHPESTHLDITKMLGDEWINLPENKKKPYLLAAEKDRERYLQEMKDYNVTHPPQPKKPKPAKSITSTTAIAPNDVKASKTNDAAVVESNVATVAVLQRKLPSTSKGGTREIQIFTDEFLEHNKEMESELKALRKSFTDYELQNSNLERYIENMKNGIEGMNAESVALKTKNAALEKYFNKLKAGLASALNSLSLPIEKGATVVNIENYMTELAKMTAPTGIINKAKDSIRKLDLQSIQS